LSESNIWWRIDQGAGTFNLAKNFKYAIISLMQIQFLDTIGINQTIDAGRKKPF